MNYKFIAVNKIILFACMHTKMCSQVTIINICYFINYTETRQRIEDKRQLAKDVDELKDQAEHHSTTLRIHSQIVATHC